MAGAPVVATQEGEDGTVQEDATAVRVAHASPDTPSVEIYLEESGAGGTGAGDDATGAGGNETDEGGATDGEGGETSDEEPAFSGIGFGGVSNYQEVDPGTYRIRVVATENTGLIEGIFEEGEEHIVFEQDVELSAGTTYTAVAYGELDRANLGEATGTGGQDDAMGDEGGTDEGDAGTGGEAGADGETGSEDAVGEDTGTAGNETTDTAGEGGDGGVLVDQLAFGEHQYVELEPGDHSIAFRETDAPADGATGAGEGTVGDDGSGTGDDAGAGDDTAGGDVGNTTGGEDGDTAGDDQSLGEGSDDKAFQVELLEDQLSVSGAGATGDDAVGTEEDGGVLGGENTTGGENGTGGEGQDDATGGDGTSRLRIFHAVPDVDAVEVLDMSGGEGAGDGEDGGVGGDDGGVDNGTGADGEGDDTLGGGEDAAGADTGGGGGGGLSVEMSQVSTGDGSVYSGFAIGYFEPETAGGSDSDDAAGDGGDVTADEGGDDGTAGSGGGDNTTAGADGENSTGDGDDITEDVEDRDFEFVTVTDAQDGERTDGGTGGFLSVTMQSTASD